MYVKKESFNFNLKQIEKNLPKFKIKDDIEENFKFLNNVAETKDDLKKELIEILRDVNSDNKEELLKFLN